MQLLLLSDVGPSAPTVSRVRFHALSDSDMVTAAMKELCVPPNIYNTHGVLAVLDVQRFCEFLHGAVQDFFLQAYHRFLMSGREVI